MNDAQRGDTVADLFHAFTGLRKLVLDEYPVGSLAEVVETWDPMDGLTDKEKQAIIRFERLGNR